MKYQFIEKNRSAFAVMSGTSGKAGGLKDLNRSKRLEELRRS